MTSPFSAPNDQVPWLVRTDFSDGTTWRAIAAQAAVDPEDDLAVSADDAFSLVDDPVLADLTPVGLMGLHPDPHGIYLLLDHVAVDHPDHPLLAVDPYTEPGRSFRLLPDQVQLFVVNMALSTMDFADFADGVDADGIFRGFGPGGDEADGAPGRPPEGRTDPVGEHPGAAAAVSDLQGLDLQGPEHPDDTLAPTITLAFGQQRPSEDGAAPHGR